MNEIVIGWMVRVGDYFLICNVCLPVAGMLLMLHVCSRVDIYEYVPSMRMTKRCHYYEVRDDPGCSLGDWHPLAAEKLLALHMAQDEQAERDVFVRGRLTLTPGQCR